MKQLLTLVLTILFYLPVLAQDAPGSEIYVIDFSVKKDGTFKIEKPINLTDRPGYDNQPHFLEDGESILYTSIRRDEQADIYKIDMTSRQPQNLTQTLTTSEYSPTPREDGKHFSVVMVEEDRKTQRLWQFTNDGRTKSALNEHLKSVGYHCWLDDKTMALFVVGKPNTLQVSSLSAETADLVAGHVGRCIATHPKDPSKFLFVHKIRENQWHIKTMDLASFDINTVSLCLKGSEDFAVMNDGSLLMGSEGKLFRYADNEWKQVADLTEHGIQEFNRIALSPKMNRLAIVVPE